MREEWDINRPRCQAESVLAWAVREGATNILRHSQAATVSISAGRSAGRVWVQIVSDGAEPLSDFAGTLRP
jgi:two-component system, NarL family, sensor histidine kinase DesK